MKEVTVELERRKGLTIVRNSLGNTWQFKGNQPAHYALATLVCFTMEKEAEKRSIFSDRFKISMTVSILDNENEKK